ncbi:MAG: hypothetical protein FJW29_04710 [Acidobacteria bacterium]|nr:hypothetical protein [Acidobacteriota bacterium]
MNVRLWQRPWGRALVLLSAFWAITVAMAAPWTLHPATRLVANHPDVHLFVWTLAWDAHAFVTQPLRIFDANTFFPFGNSLAYSENLIGSALLSAPVQWLTGNAVLALNLVSMLTVVLSGAGAYRLGRALGLSRAASVVAGVAFAFAPPRFVRMGQLHLTAIQWIPFALASLLDYLNHGRRRDVLLAVAFATLEALSSGHGAVFLLVAVVLLLAYRLIVREPLRVAQWIPDLGAPGVLLLAPAVLVFVPYLRAQREVGLARSLENWEAHLDSFLASTSYLHQWLLSLATTHDFTRDATAWLFPGYLPLVLAGVALLRPVRDRAPFYFLALTVVSVLMMTGGPLSLWPHLYALPGFSFIRVPSRFGLLAMLGVAMLAGIGLQRLVEGRAPRRTWAAALAVSGLMLGEFASPPTPGADFTVHAEPIDRWVNTLPAGASLAEVPVPSPGNAGAFERQQTTAMLHSMAHWRPIVQGYSGIRPLLQLEILTALTAFPDELSLHLLTQAQVDYVLVHADQYPDGRWPAVLARIEAEPRLRLVHVEGEGRIYQLLPP